MTQNACTSMTKRTLLGALGMCLALTLWSPAAHASLVDAINDVRESGCDGRRGISAPLDTSRKLNGVAKRLARGEKLNNALEKEGYRALHSASMFMSNTKSDRDIARALGQRACSELRNTDVREMGAYKKGADIWIVLAAPFGAPALKNAAAVSAEVLRLANQARARGRRCGGKPFAAVPPLQLEEPAHRSRARARPGHGETQHARARRHRRQLAGCSAIAHRLHVAHGRREHRLRPDHAPRRSWPAGSRAPATARTS